MKIITYGSLYGASESYAKELSKRTGINAVKFDQFESKDEIETLIHIGGLYAGGVKGLNEVIKKAKNDTDLIIVSVGLADPKIPENREKINSLILNSIPDENKNKVKIFNFRGGIDYSKLSLLHRFLMYMIYRKAKGVSEEKRTEESKLFVETYNKKVDFVDFKNLDELIKVI